MSLTCKFNFTGDWIDDSILRSLSGNYDIAGFVSVASLRQGSMGGLELEVNEDDIEEFIMGHEDELTIEELQEILNEEHQETQRNVSPSEQEEDEKGRKPTSAIKDILKK
ncbi:uncharacterized protein TNCV_1059171 [Trichonephila clavipes]|nr:uncharacterized protein TNCV_1059171 [Trichonephila clavipes]